MDFVVPWRQPARAGPLSPPPPFRGPCLWPPLETTGLGFWPWTMAGSLRPLVLPPPPCPAPVWPATASPTSAPSMECCHGSMPSPPASPMHRCSSFVAQVRSLPRTTEAERLAVQRIGQDIFRASLMEYWQGCCPLTGISDPDLLRASHIIPWKQSPSSSHPTTKPIWPGTANMGLARVGKMVPGTTEPS